MMESRNIMWVGLAQVLAVVFGFVALGIVLKIHGWPAETTFQFNTLPKLLRLYGYWLMLVPLVWTILAVVVMNTERGPGYDSLVAGLGVALVGFIILSFLSAIALPGRTRHVLADSSVIRYRSGCHAQACGES